MTTNKTMCAVIGAVMAMGLAACGGGGDDDADAAIDAVSVDSSGGTDAPAGQAMPALFTTQVDRFGRPAVNTALNAPFNGDSTAKDAAKGAYNSAQSATAWQGFIAEFAANLAIIDALDTNSKVDGCGNQPLFNPAEGTPTSGYVGLAGALADDRMYLDTTQSQCGIYLGVEAFTLGLTETRSCGGRVPAVLAVTQDPIDMSYAVLAGGLGLIGVVTDGIGVDDQQANVSNDTFPFLADPTAPL